MNHNANSHRLSSSLSPQGHLPPPLVIPHSNVNISTPGVFNHGASSSFPDYCYREISKHQKKANPPI